MALDLSSKSNGTAFLVSAGIVYEIIAAACSSPQTAEINIGKRGDTLMKWVHIGVGTSVVFVVIAAWIDPSHRSAILSGGSLAAVIMYAYYVHAKSAGMKAVNKQTTEQY